MSAANLDAIKKKYKFKEIAVATWRDPSLSVLSARGGLTSPALSSTAPYIPTYKIKYNIPEPTDDEESVHDDQVDNNSTAEAPELPQEQLPEDLQIEVEIPELFDSQPLEDIQEAETADTPADEAQSDQAHEPPEDEDGPLENVTLLPITEAENFELEATVISETEASVEISVIDDTAPEEGKDVELSADIPAVEESIEVVLEPVADAQGTMDPEEIDTPSTEEHVEGRRVSFAPDTPEPKQTARKKKTAKGANGKKKRFAVPIDSLPPDVVAMIDGAFDGLPPPPPAPPAPLNDDAPVVEMSDTNAAAEAANDEPQPEDQASPGEQPANGQELESEPATDAAQEDSPAADMSTKDDSAVDETPPSDRTEQQEAIEEVSNPTETTEDVTLPVATDVVEAPAELPNATVDPILDFSLVPPTSNDVSASEKPSKKKSSKSGKDKAKKKFSMSKSRDASPPPLGLGIDHDLPPVPDIDDMFKDLPPPPPPPPLDVVDVLGEVIAGQQTDAPVAEKEPEADAELPNGSDEVVPVAADDLPPPAVVEVVEDANVQEATSDKPELDPPTESAKIGSDEVDKPADEPTSEVEAADFNDVTELPSAEVDAMPLEATSSPADSGIEFDRTDSKDELVEGAANEVQVEDQPSKEPASFDETPAAEESSVADDAPKDTEALVDESEKSPEPEEATSEEAPIAVDSTEEPAGDIVEVVEPPAVEAADETPLEQGVTNGDGPQVDIEPQPPEPCPEEQKSADVADATDEPNVEASAGAGTAETTPSDGETIADAENQPEESNADEGPGGETEVVNEESTPDPDEPEKDVSKDPPPQEVPSESSSAETKTEESEMPPDAPKDEDPPQNLSIQENPPDEGHIEPVETTGEAAKDVEDAPKPPPSPNLSKSSSNGSHKHKADHWERKHAESALKDVFEDSKALLRRHANRDKNAKDDVRVKDRSHKSRLLSLDAEEEEARRRRKALRRAEEAARLVEEGKKRLEDERARRARHEESRAARKAEREAEEQALRARTSAETVPREEAEAKRSRHREKGQDREPARPQREAKFSFPTLTMPALPKSLGFTNGESVHGATLIRTTGGGYRQATIPPATRRKEEPKDPAREIEKQDAVPKPPSSSGDKPHHKHRHHHHKSESDRRSRSHRESDRQQRRPVLEERPRSFFGTLIQGLER